MINILIQFKVQIRIPVYFSAIRRKLNGSTSPYGSIEHFLMDLAKLLANIQKFAADKNFLDTAELAKHSITELLRKNVPKMVHFWVGLIMRPSSPLLQDLLRAS